MADESKLSAPSAERLATPSVAEQVAGRPRGAYVPLTLAEIDAEHDSASNMANWLQVSDDPNSAMVYPMPPHIARRLCDMAINCLLYGEEIQRLRDRPSAPSSAPVASDDVCHLGCLQRLSIIEECAKVCDYRAAKKGKDDEAENEAAVCAAMVRALKSGPAEMASAAPAARLAFDEAAWQSFRQANGYPDTERYRQGYTAALEEGDRFAAMIQAALPSAAPAAVLTGETPRTDAFVREMKVHCTDPLWKDTERLIDFAKTLEIEHGNMRRLLFKASSAAPAARLTDWLRENAPDCGDNSCMFGGRGKGGMRTNGGCRCFQGLPSMRRIYAERMFEALSACSATPVIVGVDTASSLDVTVVHDGKGGNPCVLRSGCYQPGQCSREQRCCHDISAADSTAKSS